MSKKYKVYSVSFKIIPHKIIVINIKPLEICLFADMRYNVSIIT